MGANMTYASKAPHNKTNFHNFVMHQVKEKAAHAGAPQKDRMNNGMFDEGPADNT